VAGSVVFVFLTAKLEFGPTRAALWAVAATFVFRVATIAFNWRTTSVSGLTAAKDDD
jgi:hypothetical protein